MVGQTRAQFPRLIPAAMSNEIVKRNPPRRMKRRREQNRCVRRGDPGNLRPGNPVVLHMLHDVQRTDQVKGSIRMRQRRDRSNRGATAGCAEPRQRWKADVDKVCSGNGQARAESGGDFKPSTGLCHQGAHQRPGIESLGTDQSRIGPEPVVKILIASEKFSAGASLGGGCDGAPVLSKASFRRHRAAQRPAGNRPTTKSDALYHGSRYFHVLCALIVHRR